MSVVNLYFVAQKKPYYLGSKLSYHCRWKISAVPKPLLIAMNFGGVWRGGRFKTIVPQPEFYLNQSSHKYVANFILQHFLHTIYSKKKAPCQAAHSAPTFQRKKVLASIVVTTYCQMFWISRPLDYCSVGISFESEYSQHTDGRKFALSTKPIIREWYGLPLKFHEREYWLLAILVLSRKKLGRWFPKKDKCKFLIED